ncbi:telomerase RNA component interacting RNase [Leptodactylus fuscus]|uniref:telomerase RNA component interacting RNase n=1 Tax=Leptodactylus fuscus TaxID=238119 RepID=UPI003F4E6D82
MAEESPRPSTEEDTEEEGEEAAEAPVRKVLEETGDETAAAPDSPPPPPPGEEDEASPPAIPSKAQQPPLEQDSPSRPPRLPTFPPGIFPTAAAAFYPTRPVEAGYIPEALAYSSPAVPGVNHFANDGSFLELFKKKMEATSSGVKEESKGPEEKKPEPDKRKPVSFVGKRRGGAKLALKTGIVVKKPKTDDEEIMTHKGGAWAQYMAEVKKYKAHQCSDDDKTRPLVK